jgi:hypothetical protein
MIYDNYDDYFSNLEEYEVEQLDESEKLSDLGYAYVLWGAQHVEFLGIEDWYKEVWKERSRNDRGKEIECVSRSTHQGIVESSRFCF